MGETKSRRGKSTKSVAKPPNDETASASKQASVLESITESWLKASKDGDLQTLKSLRASGMDINQTNKYGEMAVHYSAALGQIAVLEWLYSHGASFRHGNDMGATPLHMAVSHSREDVVVFMLERGVDPNLRTKRGATALHIASATSSVKLVKLLVAAGGDPRATTIDGQTPIDYAMKGGNTEIIVFLESSALAGVGPAGSERPVPSSSGVATHGKERLEAIQKQTSGMRDTGSGSHDDATTVQTRSMATSVSGLPPRFEKNTTSNDQNAAEQEQMATAKPPLRVDVATSERTADNGADEGITSGGTVSSPPPPKLSPKLVADALRAASINDSGTPSASAPTQRVLSNPATTAATQPSSPPPLPRDSSEPRKNPLVDSPSAAFTAAPSKPLMVDLATAASAAVAAGGGATPATAATTSSSSDAGPRAGRMYSSFAPLAEAPTLEDYVYKFVASKSGARPNYSDPRCWRRVIVRLVQNFLLVFKNDRDMKPSSIICLEDAFIRDSSLEVGVMYTFAITHFKTPGSMNAFGTGVGSGVLEEHFFQTRGTGDVESWVKFLSQATRSNVKSLIATSREADLSTREELETASRALTSIQQENEHYLQETLSREAPIAEEKRIVEKMRGHLGASAKARNAIGSVPWDDVSAASVNVEMALKKVEQKRKMLLLAAGGARNPQQQTVSAASPTADPAAVNKHVSGAVAAFAKAGRARRGTFAPNSLKHIAEQLTEAEKNQDNFQNSLEHNDIMLRRQQELFKQQSKPYTVYYGSADDENNLVGEMDIHENETVNGLRRQLARELKLKRDGFALRFGDTATLGPGEHGEVQAISVDANGPIIILPFA